MDLSKIRCIIFDLDGTLVDTTELILHSFRESFRLAGVPAPTDAEFLAQIGRPLTRQMAGFNPDRAPELLKLYQQAYEEFHDHLARSFPGVKEALEGLRDQGFTLGIATSKRDFTTRQALEFFDIGAFFSVVITASDTDKHKPDPEPLFEAMRRLGVEAAETTYIGDSPHDLKCAHAAGVAAGAVAWSPFDREVLVAEKPDYWVREPATLLELFPALA